jgi:hypothetical protein
VRGGLVSGVALAALAVNFVQDRSPARAQAVLSDFVNLGADPGAGGIFRLDFLVSNAARAARREERLDHVHPMLLDAHAQGAGLTPEEMRRRINDPNVIDPFDITGLTPPDPGALQIIEAGNWNAMLLPGNAPGQAAEWLLYFNDNEWFYAPLATDADRAALSIAHPGLGALASAQSEGFNG